jgi:3-oxoacyl-[acyl-carrier-protein] synthase III
VDYDSNRHSRTPCSKSGDKTSDFCIAAAKEAMEEAQVTADDIEFIILGTISPDMRFHATAIFVQDTLKCENAVAFDVSATCSGFLYALTQAEAMIALGRAKTGLVIGAELMTPITDWTDRSTCILFGDGAGPMVLTAANDDEHGVLSTYIGSGGNTSNYYIVLVMERPAGQIPARNNRRRFDSNER